jgi:membrane-associated phospholipid phosphatase
MDTAKQIAVGVVLPLVAVFGLELLYRDTLFETTLRDVPLMQAKGKLRPLMENISTVGGMPATFFVLVVASNLMSKPAAFYLISGVLFVQYMTEALKSFYLQPRPFWVSDSISSSQCLLGYGNPSRHLLSNTFLWTTIYLHKYYDIGVKTKKMSVFCTAYIIKMAITSVGFVYLVLMMCSRVYLGAHSWNQAFFGASLGVSIAIIGHRSVKSWFYGLWTRSLGENRYNINFSEVFRMGYFIAPFVLASLILLTVRLD